MPKLNSNSVEQLQEVLNTIKEGRIKEFSTQNRLYAMIEDIKFPWLINSKQHIARRFGTNYNTHTPLYAQRNYEPIVKCLMKNKVLYKHDSAKRYGAFTYTVNWEVLEKLIQFTNEY